MKNDQIKIKTLAEQSKELLIKLINIPSLSKQEQGTADFLQKYFEQKNIKVHRKENNIWLYNKYHDKDKPTLLLNSHHDTVKPNPGYLRDPFRAEVIGGKLYGLGSNDAGGCLVSLIGAFLFYYGHKELAYNICLLASAEEEISGKNGVELVYRDIDPCEFAIVGEPTQLNLAVAEKGLMVLDCEVYGESGHAARDEGVNAIYQAMEDLAWFRTYEFDKESPLLGKVKMNVTLIQSGTQHNVIPSLCSFVVDVRTTELYTNQEVLDIIRKHVKAKVIPRSIRLSSSMINLEHPIVKSGLSLGKSTFGSPTLSDQALLPIPSLKVGPGDSARSHMADEYIYIEEIYEGIQFYIDLLRPLLKR